MAGCILCSLQIVNQRGCHSLLHFLTTFRKKGDRHNRTSPLFFLNECGCKGRRIPSWLLPCKRQATCRLHPSGESRIVCKRFASSAGNLESQSGPTRPTSIRSRRWVRSLSRKAANFIRTNASNATSRNESPGSDSET